MAVLELRCGVFKECPLFQGSLRVSLNRVSLFNNNKMQIQKESQINSLFAEGFLPVNLKEFNLI